MTRQEVEALKLPWQLKEMAAPLGVEPPVLLADGEGRPINSNEQKHYAVEAANNLPNLFNRLMHVEMAYVRMCQNAGATENRETILARLYEGSETQPVKIDLTRQTSIPTTEPHKVPENVVSARNSATDAVPKRPCPCEAQ